MGKYMKKSKITSDVAGMEASLSPHCSLGVRTRAKTLALQRQQQQQESQKSPTPLEESPLSYLELRSRRLEKPPFLGDAHRSSNRTGEFCAGNPSPKIPRVRVRSMESVESVALDLEASCGENNLECESRDRSSRESTPCSLMPESDTLKAPGSTTKQGNYDSGHQRIGNYLRSKIPTAREMDEFFAIAEQHQQRVFIEKYNYDILIDSPLPGRYNWVQVMP